MVRLGTCSWKYDSWKGIIYPAAGKFNYLAEYAKHFTTVEIDHWFWSLHSADKITLPLEKDVQDYNNSVPDDFLFTIKVPNSLTLTHFYKKKKTDPLITNPHFLSKDLYYSFIKTLKPIKTKTGVLIFQFEYLNKEKMNSQMQFIEMFESFIENIKGEFRIGVEIRNPNYLNQNFFEFIKKNNLVMVFLHGYYMPPMWEVFDKFKNFIKGTVVLRLHAPDRKGIEVKTGNIWNNIVEPKDDDIEKIIDIIKYLESQKVDTYVNVNNHFEGSAPLTINKIKDRLIKD